MDYFVLRFDHGYEKRDFMAIQRLYQRTVQPWWWKALAVVMLVCGVIGVVCGALVLAMDREVFGQALFILLMSGLILLLTLFRTRINAWAARRQAMKTENLTVKLSAEGLTETSSTGTFFMPYGNVERIFHYKECYFLFLDKRHAHILPERAFVVGDVKDFPAFIEDRTGKRVEYI